MEWRRFNGEKIKSDIILEVEKTLLAETAAGHKLKVCIGTDSQVKGEVIEFATVIVFVREKRGGFMFISMDKKRQQSKSKSQRKKRRNNFKNTIRHGRNFRRRKRSGL